MKKPVIIITAIIAILVGSGLICPALAQMKCTGSLVATEVGLLFLGTSLTLAGCFAFVKALRLHRA